MQAPASLHLDLAQLSLTADGIPCAPAFDDLYHAKRGALAQAELVFLQGTGLPEGWRGRDCFVVLETGFGLGHNFLATWRAWRQDPQRSRCLHFISVEKHPFQAADLSTAHQAAGVPLELSAQLTAQWPALLPGWHRLSFDQEQVVLTLLFGEAEQILHQCVARPDAIFLDGFAPAKNPAMWSPGVFQALAKLAHQDTRLATWAVSANVRQGLTDAGFSYEKHRGFGGKRERLSARVAAHSGAARRTAPASPTKRQAIVIGAGLAGSAISARLAARGWQISVFERGPAPAQGASGNLAGVCRPHLSADDNPLAQLSRAGFLYAIRQFPSLTPTLQHAASGVLHLARDAAQARKLHDTLQQLAAPTSFVQSKNAEEASALAGQSCAFGGWWFPAGVWLHPPSLCQAQFEAAGPALHCHFNQNIAKIARNATGEWQVFNTHGDCIGSAPTLILANAHEAAQLLQQPHWLPLDSARGQVSYLPATQFGHLKTSVCGSGYLTPPFEGLHSLGASFVAEDADTQLRLSEHEENLTLLHAMLPNSAAFKAGDLRGRASLRATSPDRLPFVGALPWPLLPAPNFNPHRPPQSGLWLLSAFGARGLVWGQLCAELLASQINNEPLPLARNLVTALNPLRYIDKPQGRPKL